MRKRSPDPELDGLLGHKQKENFVIEQIGDSYIATSLEEMTPEEREEAIEDKRIDVQHPTYDEWKKAQNSD